jgi:AAA family ATP:ADP antiporter
MSSEKKYSIQPSELWAAGLMSFSSFFLYFGYEMLRSSTSSLFNQAFGVDNLPYALALTPFMLAGMIWIYGRLLTRFGPERTLVFTTLFSALVFCASFYLFHSGNKWGAGFLYIYKEAYIVVIIEQYWSFINSRLTVHSAKRLSGPVIGISTLGGILGGLVLKFYAERFGSASMFLGAAVLMIPSAWLSALAFRKAGEPKQAAHEKPSNISKDAMGMSLFRAHPALLALLTIVVLSQVVATGLQLRFQGALQSAFPNPDEQTAYSGAYHMWLNGICIFFQFVITPLAMRFLKTTWVQVAIPLVHLTTCLCVFFAPTFFNISSAYLIFKALDYSLFKASKEIFYVPFSFDIRYRSKQIIDSFGYRFGKGLSSTGLVILKSLMEVTQPFYSTLAVGGSLIWVFLALPVARALSRVSHKSL